MQVINSSLTRLINPIIARFEEKTPLHEEMERPPWLWVRNGENSLIFFREIYIY